MLDLTASRLRDLAAHYRAEMEKARAATNTTGEGERLFEDLMNAALDDLATLAGPKSRALRSCVDDTAAGAPVQEES